MKSTIKITRILLNAIIVGLFTLSLIPMAVSAATIQYTVRFTATYKSGNTGTKNVYYILDNGNPILLGSVNNSAHGDFSFSPSFSDEVKVYVEIHDDALYSETLYVNGNQVSSGDEGNAGLTYSRRDTIAPTGKITSPVSGTTVTQCPLQISTKVVDDNSGIAWVSYLANYDGAWHQIASDNNYSGSLGWSTTWDCSQVADQAVELEISAQDNGGNTVQALGGIVTINLAKGAITPSTSTATPEPAFSNTATPTPTLQPGQSLAQVLGSRYNLNQYDLQNIITSYNLQGSKFLYDQLVNKGKISLSQETAILNELTVVRASFYSASSQNTTPEQWLQDNQNEVNTLTAWAKFHGINPLYVVTYGGLGGLIATPIP